MKTKIFFLFIFSLMAGNVFAQDASQLLDDNTVKKSGPVEATFKGTQLVNFETLETNGKRTLQFMIQHRFGDFSSGGKDFYGLDGPASIRLGLSYSHNGIFEFGIGRSSFQKLIDGHLKYRFLRQSAHFPLSVTLFTEAGYTTMKDPNQDATGVNTYHYLTDRFCYVSQLLIGRKFSPNLSFQISPTLVHYNLVEKITDKNNMYAIVGMGRMKISKRMAFTAEYAYRINKYSQDMTQYHNSVGIGFEIETGGHVFQIHVTNSMGINAAQAIPYTTGDPMKGNLKLGFNISRVFSIGKQTISKNSNY